MNGAEALAPSLGYKANNASHKPRTTKLKQPTEQRPKAKPQHKHIHIHSNHNNHHHHHHDRSKPKSITNHYTNGAGNGYHPQTTVRIASASTSTLTSTEETDAFLSSSLSFTPSPSPSAFHCNLHNTYTHHEADAKQRSSYTVDSNALIPLSLIHGFLRSCLQLVVNARLYCVETKSCWSSIKMFGMDVCKHGWQKGALKIDEMCRYKSLTFVVYINVLMIKSLQLINNILYQYPLELCLFL